MNQKDLEVLQRVEEGLTKEGIPYTIEKGFKYVDSNEEYLYIVISLVDLNCKDIYDLSGVYCKIARVLESVGIDPYNENEDSQVVETSEKWLISIL